jgi:hypothetical protein
LDPVVPVTTSAAPSGRAERASAGEIAQSSDEVDQRIGESRLAQLLHRSVM